MRDVTGVKVENGTELLSLEDAGGLVAARVRGPSGERVIHARKVVLATGQDSTGRWWMPDFIEALPKPLRAHTADAIDFAALKGKVVAVLGAGASALDNAATALEAGAASVHLFCRRLEPQVIQPYRWITFRGFMKHLADLDDAWRWRFMARVLGLREGFPQATYDRCAAHRNFVLHTGAPWTNARAEGDRAVVTTPQGEFAAGFPHLRHRHRHGFRGEAGACRLPRQHPHLGGPLHPAGGGAQRPARRLPLSVAGLPVHGEGAGQDAVDRMCTSSPSPRP